MQIYRAGFFRELPHGDTDGESLKGSIGAIGETEESLVVSYLEGGVTLMITGSSVDDFLDPSMKSVARLEILTDGVWVWPRDLEYYVRRYHVRLPENFVGDMKRNGWIVPSLSEERLAEIEDSL